MDAFCLFFLLLCCIILDQECGDMASHSFRSACFGVQKGETLVATTPLFYHYRAWGASIDRNHKMNIVIECVLNSVYFSTAVESGGVVVAATDGICP